MPTPRPFTVASLLSLIVFAVAWLLGSGDLGPSGDASATWALSEPMHTVLCVEETSPPRLTVAHEPTADDKRALRAQLRTTERRARLGPFPVRLRDHAHRATIEVFGAELPWMKNDYSSGFADLPSHAAWQLVPPGSFGTFALGHYALAMLLLVLLLRATWRAAGPVAALGAGLLIASDPWFLTYKLLNAGHETMLQVCLAVALFCGVRAVTQESRAFLFAGALAVGVGLHSKPTFVAPALGLLLGGAFVAGRPAKAWLAPLLGVLALLAVGSAPTWGFWALDAAVPRAESVAEGQESAGKRLRSILSGAEQRGQAAEGAQRGPQSPEHDGGDAPRKTRRDPKKSTTALSFLLDPAGFWTRHWTLRGAIVERRAPEFAAPPTVRRLGSVATATLLLLAFVGAVPVLRAVRHGRRERLRAALLLLPVVTLPVLRLLSPDPHQLALWLPTVAVAVGVGLSGLAHLGAPFTQRAPIEGDPPSTSWLISRWTALALVVLVLATAGRLHAVAAGAHAHATHGDPLSLASGQRDLAEALDALDSRSVAFLAYDAMARMEVWSAGRVRPWLYSRAMIGGGECIGGRDPAFLRQVLRAHRGGHLVIVPSPPTGPGGRPDPVVTDAQVEAAATGAGVAVTRAQTLEDRRGRWLATIWAIDRTRTTR
mgnify:CR=1 FL=1